MNMKHTDLSRIDRRPPADLDAGRIEFSTDPSVEAMLASITTGIAPIKGVLHVSDETVGWLRKLRPLRTNLHWERKYDSPITDEDRARLTDEEYVGLVRASHTHVCSMHDCVLSVLPLIRPQFVTVEGWYIEITDAIGDATLLRFMDVCYKALALFRDIKDAKAVAQRIMDHRLYFPDPELNRVMGMGALLNYTGSLTLVRTENIEVEYLSEYRRALRLGQRERHRVEPTKHIIHEVRVLHELVTRGRICFSFLENYPLREPSSGGAMAFDNLPAGVSGGRL